MQWNSQFLKEWFITFITFYLIITFMSTDGYVTKAKRISCMDYDSKKCAQNKTYCDFRNVTCEAGMEHCMAVLKLIPRGSVKSFEFIYLTCWPRWDIKGCPKQEGECVQVRPSQRFIERKLLHCCCKGDMCNNRKHLKYIQSPKLPKTGTDETSNPGEREATVEMPDNGRIRSQLEFRPGTVMYTAVVILVPLLVICLLIISSYWVWRRYYCCHRVRGKPGQEMLLGGSGGSGAVTDETSLLGTGAIGHDGYKPGTLIELCKLLEIRSRGRYGCVWRSKMRGSPHNKEDQDEHEVAVKVFPPQDRQSWITEQEIYRLRGLRHPNILYYIGADQCGENVHAQLWIVTEYHPVGSVADFLRSHTLCWPQLLSILRSMAEGMRHLHEEQGSHKPSIAHRDLKSKNVLLKANRYEACIADMGLALKFDIGQRVGDTHAQVGTRRYMAPEVLEGAIQFSRDSFLRIDTYAMALVMWEMMTRCNFLEAHHRRSERSTSGGSAGTEAVGGGGAKRNGVGVGGGETEAEAAEDADDEEEVEEEEEEMDEGLAMLEDDSSPRSTPSHSPGGGSGGGHQAGRGIGAGGPRRGQTEATGAAAVYQLPFEAELGSQPTLEAMQDFVVQRKQRPKLDPQWKLHEGMQSLCETLEECWDQDAEARLSAGLVMVRMEGLQGQLPTTRDARAADVLVRHALHRQRHRRDSSSSALGSSASSLHPLVPPPNLAPNSQAHQQQQEREAATEGAPGLQVVA